MSDSGGNSSPSVEGTLALLAGDTNADDTVNSATHSNTQSLRPISNSTNFRSDVNTDGTVNSGDAFIVRARSGSNVNP